MLDQHLWELTPWMPGRADYSQIPSKERLAAAVTTIAQFHLAAADLETAPQCSRALEERLQFVRQMMDKSTVQRWQRKTQQSDSEQYKIICIDLLQQALPLLPQLAVSLAEVEEIVFTTQPCLRDIWHDHLLFTKAEVTGLIDFGAMRTETVATDLARLLGSLVGDDDDAWQFGIDVYQGVRTLSADELRCIKLLDRANVVLSGLNWLRWLMVDRRHFEDSSQVLTRLHEIQGRLRNMRA